MRFNRFVILFLSVITLNNGKLLAQNDEFLGQVIASLKSHNFAILQAGILTTGITTTEAEALVSIQTQPPRQMRIFATQSNMIYDIYQDFTFLVNEKKVNAIIVYPSHVSKDPSFIKKISMMSRQKKIPVIAMEDSWVNSDAMLVYTQSPEPTLHVNEKVRALMKYPINDDKMFKGITE